MLIATVTAALLLLVVSFSRKAAATQQRNERGEGVISAAIAVLIFAVLGGLMFVAYKATFEKSSTKTDKVVDDISAP